MKKLEKIYHRIMTRLYRECEPPLEWSELFSSDDEVKESFDYNNHYLEQDRFNNIVNEELSKQKLNKRELGALNMEIYLGCSPTSFKKN